MIELQAKFAVGQPVNMDGDTSLQFVVTGFLWRRSSEIQVEVSWICNGDLKTAWVDEWRLSPAVPF